MKKLANTLLTLGKVALKSRPIVGNIKSESSGPLVIMGNGPSLRDVIDNNFPILESCDTLAVNFAANTPEFFKIKPRHYVLADPHFFLGKDENVISLWNNIAAIDWRMTLHIPVRMKPSLPQNVCGNGFIDLRSFNLTPGEGYGPVCRWLFRKGLAMPRPRNVLIPALMEAIRYGYKEIYLVGADHTWPHTLYVDDRNRVVTVQPHFYKENPAELDRIAEVYSGVKLHDVLHSMVVAFRSYHEIERYARKLGVRIFNSTPGSLIDAFERKSLC